MPFKPSGLNLAPRYPPRKHDLESSFPKAHFRHAIYVARLNGSPSYLTVRQESIHAVHLPVQFFLQGDHTLTGAHELGFQIVEGAARGSTGAT